MSAGRADIVEALGRVARASRDDQRPAYHSEPSVSPTNDLHRGRVRNEMRELSSALIEEACGHVPACRGGGQGVIGVVDNCRLAGVRCGGAP
eukprot:scaffold268534_cov31-Tisochrysis_lutea.AAC.3